MTIRSMTGFARVRRGTEQGEITLSVKSVNHRGLDVHFQMSPALDIYENMMRTMVKRHVARGHLDLRVSVTGAKAGTAFSLNHELLAAFLIAFRNAAAEHALDCKPDLNTAFRLQGMLEERVDAETPEGIEGHLSAALEEAMHTLNEFREREGAELAAQMRVRNASIREAARTMLSIRARALPAFQARLCERLGELLKGAGVEPQRLIQEAAMLADRSDIGEELSRLEIHAQQLDHILDSGAEIGKKLDFLLQEMNRETNTILSKTNGIGEAGLTITELALAVKSDIEKIREQSMNLE